MLCMNNYWEYVLCNDLYNSIDLDTNFTKIVNDVTCEDVRRVLNYLLSQGNRIEVTVTTD